MWIAGIDGSVVVLGPDLAPVRQVEGAVKTLAGFWMAGGRVWVRSHEGLVAM